MKKEIKVPSMGESIATVTIGKLLKENGAQVQRDEEIVEIETDKLNQVLYAEESGIITFLVKPGDEIRIGQTIATIDVQEVKKMPSPQVKIEAKEEGARKMREEWAQEVMEQKKEEVSKPPTPQANVTRKKLSTLRKVIAQRLVQAKNETAMLTTFNEVDLSHVVGLRDKYKEEFQKKHGVKLGFMPFFVKASSYALKAYPEVNSYIDRDDLVLRSTIDIAIAVSTEKGLVVPVIRGADQLSYPEIEKAIDDFAKRAKEGALAVDELKGGGFTITNGGVFGSLLSTPILNPPQPAILGMHKIVKRPVVVDDQIVIRPMMYLALSYDHRILDGKEAVSFLVHIKNSLEDPERMVLEL